MPNFEPNASEFSATNALQLAQLCKAAYLDEESARTTAQQLGLPEFIWIDLTEQFTELFAIAAAGEGYAVIAFRGTKDFDSWMDDLQATPVSFQWIFAGGPNVGDIHAGFGHALCDAWSKIKQALDNLIPGPAVAPGSTSPTLWLTGHSLGGALAVLTGAALSMWSEAPMRSVAGIYTFGQPRVGLYGFCGNFDHLLKQRTFRFVNKDDLVPRVPFRGFDYADLGQMIHFDNDGTPQLQSLEWANFLNRTLQSFEDFFNIAGHVPTDVADHSMDGYEQLVRDHEKELQALFL